MRRHVRQPVGDHRPLPLVEVPAPQVHRDDERFRRAGPIPLRGARLDAELQAGLVAVATVEDQAVMDEDQLPLAVLPDVVDQGLEVGAEPSRGRSRPRGATASRGCRALAVCRR